MRLGSVNGVHHALLTAYTIATIANLRPATSDDQVLTGDLTVCHSQSV